MKKIYLTAFFFVILFFLSLNSTYAIFGSNATAAAQRVEVRATIGAQREEIKQERKEFREEVREQRASVSAEILAKREEFKLKLATIKDLHKQQVVERVASKAAEINQNRTDEMMEVLNRLSGILNRIEEKINQGNLGNQGNLQSLIVTARTAIQTAKDAVLAQAQKEYTISITTEANLRVTVGQMMSQLEQDLRLTREKVIAARKATMDAYNELARLRNEGVASPSGEMTR